jgi:SSS family solute:Na+ symporter
MTLPQIIFLGTIGLYVGILIYVGVRAANNQNHGDFVIGSRGVGIVPTVGSLAASFRDGMGAVFWTGMAYSAGYGALWVIYGVMLSVVFMAVFGPAIRDYAEKQGFITMGDYLKDRLGVYTEKVSSFFALIKSLLIISIQLFVIGTIASMVFGIEAYVGIIGTAVVIFLYLYFGGYSSVVKTDALQFFMIIGLLIVPFFIQPNIDDVLNFSTAASMGWENSLGLFLLGFFYIIAGPDAWQRIFSARSKKVVQIAFPLSGIFLLIMTLNLIAIGYGLRPLLPEGTTADDALFSLFAHLDVASPYIIAFIGVTVMAISMSTLDTEAYVFTSSFAKNFMPKRYTERSEKYVRLSRKVITGILIVTPVISLTINDVIQFLFDAVGLIFVISPVLIMAMLGWTRGSKKQDIYLAVSILLSAFLYATMFVNEQFPTVLHNMIPLGVSTILCGLSVLVTRNENA